MSRFQVIGGVKAKKFFGGLVLSYCSLSSAIPEETLVLDESVP